jgi:uncharacterized repeat protein (TIGR03803 family)
VIDSGAIYSFNPITKTVENVHSFTGSGGAYPVAALVAGPGSIFYGTTQFGGDGGSGTIYSVDPTTTPVSFNSIYSFTEAGDDGIGPVAALVMGSNGLFYGTTTVGGTGLKGTIFSIDTTSNPVTFATVYSFTGGGGAYPYAALVTGSNGLFYGTTINGGSQDKGTIFSFNPTTSPATVNVLHSFDGTTGGAVPLATLVAGANGVFYGTTTYGGTAAFGTIFSFDPTTSPATVTVLHSFNGTTGGAQPKTALVAGPGGIFYGITSEGGGVTNSGTIFSFNPTTTPVTVETVHSFNGIEGSNPLGALVAGIGDLFYGTTDAGGDTNKGTIYVFDPTPGPIPAPTNTPETNTPETNTPETFTPQTPTPTPTPGPGPGPETPTPTPSPTPTPTPSPSPSPSPFPTPTDSYTVEIGINFSKAFATWTQENTSSVLAEIATTANVPGNRVILTGLNPGSTILFAQVIYVATYAEALVIQIRLNAIVFTDLGTYTILGVIIIPPVLQSNICFPAGTLVRTDQGEVAIDLLKPGLHTLERKAIKHITRTQSREKYLIQIRKGAFGWNKPTQTTVLSKDHKIEYEGDLVQAYLLLDYSKNVKKVKYTGQLLYNVLLDEYGIMSVNNLRCETLDPASPIACVYRGVAHKEQKAERIIFKS